MYNNSLLMVMPLPCLVDDAGVVRIESQASSGFKMWSQHFSSITACCPIIPTDVLESRSSISWCVPEPDMFDCPVRFETLPWGYGPAQHLGSRKQVGQRLEALIAQSQYLHFGVGGCTFGDWSAMAARLAYKKGRKYSVHTDWVTHKIAFSDSTRKMWRRTFDFITMKAAEKQVISKAAVGLFHGADCYNFYRRWCPNAHLVHNIHISESELPLGSEVDKKIDATQSSSKLKLVYAGRMIEMKGVFDWLDVMQQLKTANVDFEAHWLGDGPLLDKARMIVNQTAIKDCVTLHGFVSDRSLINQALFDADALVFCHLQPESPRILIEALNQATPIIGYSSDYAKDLTSSGGGSLVPVGDMRSVYETIRRFAEDHVYRRRLTQEAFTVGREFTKEKVFTHRASLVKKFG